MSTGPRMSVVVLRQLAGGALCGLVVGLLALAASGQSASGMVMLMVASLGGAGLFAWRVTLRHKLLALLFFVAAFDLSKAIVPPTDIYHSPGLYLGLGHVVMLALLAAWLLEHVWMKRRRLPHTRQDRLALVFLAWIWVSALSAPGDKVLLAASAFAYSLSVLGHYVVSHAIVSLQEVRDLIKAVVAGLFLQLAHVAAQMATGSYLPLPGSKGAGDANVGNTIKFGGLEASAFRPTGAFDHPNALADYLTLLIIPALALVLMGPRRIARRAWGWAVAVLGLATVALLVSLSRGGWAAMVLGCLVVAWVYWRLRLVGPTHALAATLLATAGLAAVLVAYPQVILRLTAPDDRSTESRQLLNDQAVAIIATAPWTGVGFGSYNRAAHEVRGPKWAEASPEYQSQLLKLVVHNHYLLVGAQLGLPALVFWCALLVHMASQAWPLRRWTDPGTLALAVGLGAALISQMLFLASDNYDVDIRIFMLWLTAGLLQALVRLHPMPAGASIGGRP